MVDLPWLPKESGMLLKCGEDYVTRTGEPVTDLRFSHTHGEDKIFTGWTGDTARIWRQDGRSLTEHHSPSHSLDHDIV